MRSPKSRQWPQEILEIAEAAEVLSKTDQKAVEDAKKQEKHTKDAAAVFRKEYMAKTKAIRERDPRALAAQVAPRLGASGASGSGALSAARLRTHPLDSNPQATIQAMAPPGAHVWRDLGKGRWHVHLPPYARFSRPWDLYGNSGASMLCLRRVWRLYLEDNGQALTTCPVVGLFTGGPTDRDDYHL